MKKILSLLALLVMTLTAFATDYTGHRTVIFGVNPPTESDNAVLTITDNGNNTFNVTFKDVINVAPDGNTDNYGTFTFSNVHGTTENGVTTIDLSNLSASVENSCFEVTEASEGVLFAKFNAEKAYARFSAKIGAWRKYDISAEFGVDDFESTGGGEPGGEDKPAIVDVVDADYAPNGAKFAFPFTINWETQKLVAKLDLSTCKRCKKNEGIITVGTDNGNGDVSLWNPNNGEANCHLYYTNYYYDYYNGTVEKLLNLHYLEKPSDEVVHVNNSLQNLEPGLVVFTFDKDGLHVGDNLIATADQMTTLYNSTSLIFGSKEGETRSYATYKYVKVVPADWTEPKEQYAVNFDKGAKSTNDRFLRSFSLQQTGKEKQTESVSVSKAAYEDHTSKVFTVEAGSEVTASFNYSGEWMHGYVYIDRDNDGEFSYTEGQWNQAGTDLVAFSFYSLDSNPKNDASGYNSTGASVTGDARSNVNPPSFTAPTEPGTYRIRFKIDWNCILPGGSSSILSDGGGVWDATLEVVAAAPTVVSTLPFENVAYTTSYGGQGTANVTFTEMSDGTFPMTFASDGFNVNAENLTKGTDEKGRTTYTGTAKRTDLDVTFTVNAVVYGEAAAQKLYMTMDNGSGFIVTVGEDPDYVAPVTYKNTLKVVRGTDTKTYENAEVSVLAKGEGKYEVVLPEFSDMDSAEGTTPGTIGKLTFVADGVEADGKLKLTASSVETTQEGGEGWESQTFTASMDATVENDQLAGTFTVVVDGYETMYTYNLYYGVKAPEVVTEDSNNNYTSNLRILDGETTVVEEAEANVNIVKYSDDTYKITLKDVSMLNQTSDLVFVGKAIAEETDSEAPRTIMAKSDGATTNFFGEEVNGTFEITEVSADEIKMEFAIEGEGVLYEGEFNYEVKTPATEPFCKENYVADGNGFEWEFAVDWDTQKVVMSIDPSTCTGNCEDVIGLGAVPTAWVNTLHLYRTIDQKLQGYFQVPGGNNNNTDKFAETVPFLVEVSKAQGFVVNDEVKIAASAMSYLFTLPTVKMGTGEGANDKSRATYNYVKVVDKDWTKDPETGINATTVAEGEFEVFSVDGVKLSKLQKGLNIVRSADGKVKKVLVK